MRFRLNFPALIAFGFASFLAQLGYTQDRIFDLLPYQEGIYLWSDDVPTLLESIKQLQPTNTTQWQSVYEKAQLPDSEPAGVIASLEKHRIAQLVNLAEIWQQLDGDKIFDGEVCLIQRFDPEYGSAPPLFIAHSSAEESELARFVESTISLTKPIQLSSENSDKDNAKTKGQEKLQTNEFWRYENGWFCLSVDSDLLDDSIAHLAKRTTAETTLAQDRSFQRVMAKLRNESLNQPAASLYLTPQALAMFTQSLGEVSNLFADIQEEDWETYYLDSIRGLGARLYVFDEESQKSNGVSIGLEAFAVVTQPRRGILRALGNASNPVRLDMLATPYEPLRRLFVVRFDERELYDGILEAAVHESQESGQQSPDEVKRRIEEDTELPLFKHIRGMCEVYSNGVGSTSGGRPNWFCIEVDDMEQFGFAMANRSRGEDSVQRRLQDFGEPYDQLKRDDAVAWGSTEEATQRRIANYEARLLDMAGRLEKLRAIQDDSQENSREISRLQMEISFTKSMLKDAEERTPDLIGLGNWIYTNDVDAELLQSLMYGFEHEHPQLLQLENDLTTIRKTFGTPVANAAIFSFWGDKTADRLAEENETAGSGYGIARRANDQATDPNGAPILTQEQQDDRRLWALQEYQNKNLSTLVLRQLERIVVSGSTTSDGFSISGIVIQDQAGEPDEEIKR